jgi:hypothetical protein
MSCNKTLFISLYLLAFFLYSGRLAGYLVKYFQNEDGNLKGTSKNSFLLRTAAISSGPRQKVK